MIQSPVSSEQLHKLAYWVSSLESPGDEMHKVQSETEIAHKEIQEYNPNLTYYQGDIVMYNNKKWSCRIDKVTGTKPPYENNVTFNDAWKLLPNGGRRKTKRRGKKGGKKSRR